MWGCGVGLWCWVVVLGCGVGLWSGLWCGVVVWGCGVGLWCEVVVCGRGVRSWCRVVVCNRRAWGVRAVTLRGEVQAGGSGGVRSVQYGLSDLRHATVRETRRVEQGERIRLVAVVLMVSDRLLARCGDV